jgi:putative acetyltransferase
MNEDGEAPGRIEGERVTVKAPYPMRVERISEAHVPQAIELVRATLAEFGLAFGEGSATDAQMLGLPGSYRDVGGEFFVALDKEGMLVGTAGVAPVAETTLELRKMYLAPHTRGHGVGQALLEACLAFCRAHGAKAVVLDTVDDMHAAVAFYERNGFKRDDTQIRGCRCSRGYRLDL